MATYSITQVSKKYHLPVSTLRYYEDVGLLCDVDRNGKNRIYDQANLDRLDAIICFKETGMSIAELQNFFRFQDNDDDLDDMVALLAKHCKRVDDQLALLEKNRKHIQRKLKYYSGIRQSKQNHQPMPKWEDYVLTDS